MLRFAALFTSLAICAAGLLAAGIHDGVRSDVGEPVQPTGGTLGGATGAIGMRFGIDAGSVERFAQAAGPPDYGTIWVGRWNLDLGWRDTDRALAALRDANVTPAVHFFYWGDDLGPACLESGCNGKDTAQWDALAAQLAQHLDDVLDGRPVLVILETEFNKHGVHTDERLDGLLADKATQLRTAYPAAQVVLGLGNWYPAAWPTWDRAAAASDYLGLQALAASTRDGDERQIGLAERTLEGVQELRGLFGKPVIVQDVAVSSYPEPDNLGIQEEVLDRFAAALPALQRAGVEAVIYRSFIDVPDMGLGNFYAEAERHWGLAWHGSGDLKPAGQVWLAAIQRARLPSVPVDMAAVVAK